MAVALPFILGLGATYAIAQSMQPDIPEIKDPITTKHTTIDKGATESAEEAMSKKKKAMMTLFAGKGESGMLSSGGGSSGSGSRSTLLGS